MIVRRAAIVLRPFVAVIPCLLGAFALSGCVDHLPPASAPAKQIPLLSNPPPDSPPAAGNARVILDADGEKAWVSRVTGTTRTVGYRVDDVGAAPPQPGGIHQGLLRSDELLCVAPCIVDLRAGAHEFVFARSDHADHETTATVVLPSNTTTVVRHRIGRTPHYSSSYTGGALLTLMGVGFTAIGGTATAVGAAVPERDSAGEPSGKATFLTLGLVFLGVGLATGIPGALMLLNNRPSEQPGATTTWVEPSNASGQR